MPWCDQFPSKSGIRNLCRTKLASEIFDPMKVENEWKILIVDDFAMKLISSCFKTEEIMAYNIALIENLHNLREPFPYLSAIFILYPSLQNSGYLQTDFVCYSPKYLSVHLFFLSAVSDELFKELLKYASPGFVQTFKEIDFLFLPYESQVFSLGDDRFFSMYFDAYKELDVNYCAFVAKKLATFFSVLNAQPRIRYRRNYIKNFIIAEAVQQEFKLLKENLPSTSSDVGEQPMCELLILDRGFDCISPVIHEFTLQAMAHDILNIEDDIYEYAEIDLDKKDDENGENGEKMGQISLTEAESLWCKLRHEHIASVGKVIEDMFETQRLLRQHPKMARYKKLPDLGEAVKSHVAFRQCQPYIVYKRLASECMKSYCAGINVIAEVEQILAAGTTSSLGSMKEMKTSLMTILCNADYSISEKLRVLLLYVFFAKGVTKQEFDDIITRSQLPFSEARYITNVLHLDVDVFRPGSCKSVDLIPSQTNETGFKQSRWTPAVRSIMLNCIEGKLDPAKYPYLDSKEHELVTTTKRTGYWCRDKKDDHMSRLIVFVAGGITHSEMRSAYEVMQKYKGWEVYIGGDSILTPKRFMSKLKELKCFIYKDM